MYHGDSFLSAKASVEASLQDPEGRIRLVFVSSALGRGANYPGINRLIFLRPPYSLVRTSQHIIFSVRVCVCVFKPVSPLFCMWYLVQELHFGLLITRRTVLLS